MPFAIHNLTIFNSRLPYIERAKRKLASSLDSLSEKSKLISCFHSTYTTFANSPVYSFTGKQDLYRHIFQLWVAAFHFIFFLVRGGIEVISYSQLNSWRCDLLPKIQINVWIFSFIPSIYTSIRTSKKLSILKVIYFYNVLFCLWTHTAATRKRKLLILSEYLKKLHLDN